MVKLFQRVSRKAGLPPGSPVHVGEKKIENILVSIIDYDKDSFEQKEAAAVEECFPFRESPSVSWINITGLHEVTAIEKICGHFGIHPLIIEDILNTQQRPKMNVFEDHIYIVLSMQSYDRDSGQIDVEQLSIILGKGYVLTFQEKEGDIFDPLRNRIRNSSGRIRRFGADYLAYAIIDSVTDNYFKVLEGLGEEIEFMEDKLIANPVPDTLQNIHTFKREILLLRKSVWPLREVISVLEREETVLIRKTTRIYIRDIYDHVIQVIDTLETYRDIISGMLDVYLSSVSNKMNEVMKVLTIFAAIFIPLTFIAGIYGMNFNTEKSPLNMPELNMYFGYPLALALMAAVAAVMLFYFKRKKWI